MKTKMKKISVLTLICVIVLALLSLTCLATNAYAVTDGALHIEYDGDTKIISNVQNYLAATPNARSSFSAEDKENTLLESIGFTQNEIARLSAGAINDYMTATKIYSVSKSSVDDPLSYDDGYIEMLFTVTDDGYELEGRRTFTLSLYANWIDTFPRARHRDNIAFSWTDGALTGGTITSSHSMTYWEHNYSIFGSSLGAEHLTAPASAMWEQNQFPGYAIIYDLPVNSYLHVYKGICMNCETKVTATEDFAAIASYGHYTVVGTAEASITTTGLGLGISFDSFTEVYTPGIIRIYL